MRLQHELMCKRSYHFPLGLGGHAGVAVDQRLGRLWKRVGDTVAEALAQTGSEGGGEEGRRRWSRMRRRRGRRVQSALFTL